MRSAASPNVAAGGLSSGGLRDDAGATSAGAGTGAGPLSNDGTLYQTVACVGDVGGGRVLMVDGVEWMDGYGARLPEGRSVSPQARSKIASSKLVQARPARSRVLCFGWAGTPARKYRIISCTVQVRLAATSEVWFQQRLVHSPGKDPLLVTFSCAAWPAWPAWPTWPDCLPSAAGR